MNGRQRMALAMRHQQPDRVPVMCQLAIGHYFQNTAIPPHQIWFTSQGFAQALVLLQRRYRFDGILINLPGRPDDFLQAARRIEKSSDGEHIFWKNGDITFIPKDDNAQHSVADATRPIRADFDTLDPDNLNDLDDLTDYIWGTYHTPWLAGKEQPGPLSQIPPYFYNTIDRVRALTLGEVSIHGEVFSPFTHFMELFGYENALLHLLADASKAHAVLARLTEASIAWGVAQARHGVDAVLISSAFAGGPFLSPDMYREFIIPYESQVTAAIKATGVPVYTHTCGHIGDRLQLMLETGTQGIDTLDPPPLGNTDLAEAKKQIGHKVFIKGNMNPVALLLNDDRDWVIAHAAERIRIGKPGGGYILSTACSVSPMMAPWKLELLTPLAEKLGNY